MIKLRMVILCGIVVLVSASCSTTSGVSMKSDYIMAMDSLRTTAQSNGIPREKLFYQFQLDGMSSTRHGGGSVRGGWTGACEEWSLPQGYRLIARKFSYVGRDLKITPLKEGESFFASGPRLMIKEKYYHEPRLEPYFDSVRLIDQKGNLVSEIELTRKIPRDLAVGINTAPAIK